MGYLKNEAKKTSFPHIFFLKANPMNNAIKTFIGSSATYFLPAILSLTVTL